MAYRTNANRDNNDHRGIIVSNSATNNSLVVTGTGLTNAQPMHVAIVDGSGTQITTFGGGTQYTDGVAQPAHPIGNTLTYGNGSNMVAVTSTTPLPVSGSVTANAGTNLNTSALALETGGNLATIVTNTNGVAKDSSLTTIDTDLKSNITLHAGSNIIGQVGIDQTTPGTTNKVAANLTQVNGTAVSGTNGLPSTITNNTNTADVIAGDTGFNSVVTSAGTKSYTFTTSVAGVQTLLSNTDVRGYSYMEIVYTSVGVGLALGGQFSTISGGTYVASSSFSSAPSSANTSSLGVSTGTIYTSPVRGNFFQIAVSALTSGTFTGTLTLRATPPTITSLNTAGTITGASASVVTGSITTSSTVITSQTVNGINGFIPVIISGTYAGISFNIQVSADNGASYVPTSVWDTNAQVWRNPTGGASASITPGTNASNIYYVQVPMSGGTSLIKLTSTAYTSGTGAIRMGGNFAPQPPIGLMSQLMDSAGNGRGANVDVGNNLMVADGGSSTGTYTAGTASNVVIKASAGKLFKVLVTVTGTAAVNIYDNASTNSGTIICAIPASPTVGTIYNLVMPAANGITVGGVANTPGLTISYS